MDTAQLPPSNPPPRTEHRTAALLVAAVLVVGIGVVAALTAPDSGRAEPSAPATDTGIAPTAGDHWHAALGVDDCGTWTPNWLTPVSPSIGSPVRAGTEIYAGLHSHGDGLINIEPATSDEMGRYATLGQYFKFAGFELSATSISFAKTVNEENGLPCNGKPGVLRWAVNGQEHHGNPAAYVLHNGDVIELVFTAAGETMPPQRDIPSYRSLQHILGLS
jgi:hypothetical protein